MARISFTKPVRYEFACELLRSCPSDLYQFDPGHLVITTHHDILGHLLARIDNPQQVVVLPSLESYQWLITGPTLRQLEQARQQLQHFLVPTYAFFPGQVPHLTPFDRHNKLQTLGAQIYPLGFYMLQSREEYTEAIFQQLDLWMQLEQERPAPQGIIKVSSYGVYYERFQLALAAGQWEEADRLRQEIRRLNLIAAENLLFLEIEELASQQRWRDIWTRQDLSRLAFIPVPREVRAALITAFHQHVLLAEELRGNWPGSVELFRQRNTDLGQLLTARLGLSRGPVVQVFAYQAAMQQNREELQELITASTNPAALECIKQLLRLLGPERVVLQAPPRPVDAWRQAQEALIEGNYDIAARYAEEVDDHEKKIALQMRIAFDTRDQVLAEHVLLLFLELTEEEQERLQQRYPFIRPISEDLMRFLTPGKSLESIQTPPITSWKDWFLRLSQQASDQVLAPSLEYLATVSDDRFWTSERIAELKDALLQTVTDDALVLLPLVRDALYKLVEFFLRDEAFPRVEHDYQELYEGLYVGLLSKHAREEMHSDFLLLRLADALLSTAPSKCVSICRNLQEWSSEPLKKLELWALEAFEMLIDYGLEPAQLIPWYRVWVEWMQLKQLHRDRSNLLGWLSLGKVIQPGNDALRLLQQLLEDLQQKEPVDVIGTLPEGYRICIFSLYQSAANRTQDLLLKRNQKLDVRICADEVLTDSAKFLAQTSNMSVLVTTAMKHALSYGIMPYLDRVKVVYPQSRGSTAIIHAIEEYVQKSIAEVL